MTEQIVKINGIEYFELVDDMPKKNFKLWRKMPEGYLECFWNNEVPKAIRTGLEGRDKK